MPARLAIACLMLLLTAAGPALADGASAGLSLGGRVAPAVTLAADGGLVTLADGRVALDLVGRANSATGYTLLLVDGAGRLSTLAPDARAGRERSYRAVLPRPASDDGVRATTLIVRSN